MAFLLKIETDDTLELVSQALKDNSARLHKHLLRSINRGGFYARRKLQRKWGRQLKTLAPTTAAGIRWRQIRDDRDGALYVKTGVWSFMKWHVLGGVKRFSRFYAVINAKVVKTEKQRSSVLMAAKRVKISEGGKQIYGFGFAKLKNGNVGMWSSAGYAATLVKSLRYRKIAAGSRYLLKVLPAAIAWHLARGKPN